MWIKMGVHMRKACSGERQKKAIESPERFYPSHFVCSAIIHSCCSCVTWEPCALVCGGMEVLERGGSVTPSPGSAPGLPVPTAPSDCASSLAGCPTFASGSSSLAFTSVTWRTAVKEKA